MRLAYLVSEYPATSHTFIRREINALRARGFDVATFSVRQPAASTINNARDRSSFQETFYILPVSPISLVIAHGIAALRRPARYLSALALALRHRVPGLSALILSLFYFAEAIVLARELERRGITHLHTHFANAGANVGLFAAHYLGLPWTLTLHGISETVYPAGVLLGAKIEAAQFVACASYFGRAQAMQVVAPKHWAKLFVVRCALDLQDLPKRTANGSSSRPQLISVGRLAPEKGHVGLLEAFAAVRASGIDADLTIVGDGPERVHVEQTISSLDLKPYVFLKGSLSEQETLRQIARADILVLTSFMEGLPVVLMEAMALGLPVIASRVAGIPELVTDNEHGLLFCPTDWDELAVKIRSLAGDIDLQRQLGRQGRAKVEQFYEINRAVEPLIERFRHDRSETSTQLQQRSSLENRDTCCPSATKKMLPPSRIEYTAGHRGRSES